MTRASNLKIFSTCSKWAANDVEFYADFKNVVHCYNLLELKSKGLSAEPQVRSTE